MYDGVREEPVQSVSNSRGGGVAGMSGSSESIITLVECWPEKRGVEGREGKKREKKMDGWAEGPSGDGEGGRKAETRREKTQAATSQPRR